MATFLDSWADSLAPLLVNNGQATHQVSLKHLTVRCIVYSSVFFSDFQLPVVYDAWMAYIRMPRVTSYTFPSGKCARDTAEWHHSGRCSKSPSGRGIVSSDMGYSNLHLLCTSSLDHLGILYRAFFQSYFCLKISCWRTYTCWVCQHCPHLANAWATLACRTRVAIAHSCTFRRVARYFWDGARGNVEINVSTYASYGGLLRYKMLCCDCLPRKRLWTSELVMTCCIFS